MTKEEAKIYARLAIQCLKNDNDENTLACEFYSCVLKELSAYPQGFEEYLKQYLGENDLKIIGNDVWEETKAKAEQTEWISIKDRLQIEQDKQGNLTAYCPHCHKAIWKTFKQENENEDY